MKWTRPLGKRAASRAAFGTSNCYNSDPVWQYISGGLIVSFRLHISCLSRFRGALFLRTKLTLSCALILWPKHILLVLCFCNQNSSSPVLCFLWSKSSAFMRCFCYWDLMFCALFFVTNMYCFCSWDFHCVIRMFNSNSAAVEGVIGVAFYVPRAISKPSLSCFVYDSWKYELWVI